MNARIQVVVDDVGASVVVVVYVIIVVVIVDSAALIASGYRVHLLSFGDVGRNWSIVATSSIGRIWVASNSAG